MTRHKTPGRLLAMALALILAIGMVPTTGFSAGGEIYLDETAQKRS